MNISLETRLKLTLREIVKLCDDKTIRGRARKIVLREMIRLIEGRDIEERMRHLIGMWCYQQLIGKRGRPKNMIKEIAIYLAFKTLTEKNPELQRKAIIAFLAQEFGVKQRRIYEAVKRRERLKRLTTERVSAQTLSMGTQ
jgi:hypothetical protein